MKNLEKLKNSLKDQGKVKLNKKQVVDTLMFGVRYPQAAIRIAAEITYGDAEVEERSDSDGSENQNEGA